MNVLIVDGSTVRRRIVNRAFRRSEFAVDDVLECDSVEDAIGILETAQVHVLVCDRNLPQDGAGILMDYLKSAPNSPSFLLLGDRHGGRDLFGPAGRGRVDGWLSSRPSAEDVALQLSSC